MGRARSPIYWWPLAASAPSSTTCAAAIGAIATHASNRLKRLALRCICILLTRSPCLTPSHHLPQHATYGILRTVLIDQTATQAGQDAGATWQQHKACNISASFGHGRCEGSIVTPVARQQHGRHAQVSGLLSPKGCANLATKAHCKPHDQLPPPLQC